MNSKTTTLTALVLAGSFSFRAGNGYEFQSNARVVQMQKDQKPFNITHSVERDNNNETLKNKYYTEYFKRVKEASARFKNFAKDGFKTDMGRVFVMYGGPDQIERYPNLQDTKPYEIWTYEQIEGGVTFIFADITGFSNYILIHSTKRNEYHDVNLLSRIATR